ncbi:MAG: DUF2723 domain-containing protein [Armatimonadetes bacterium]|nr:DUF2723 domain-containing protein [Armatimonadota bacterium]
MTGFDWRSNRVTVGGVGLLALLIYAYSLPPDVHYGGDCGEMACGAYCLGVGHPTGYPLYQMLGKLATLLVPVGSISWRIGLVSAAGGALAVMLLTWLVTLATRDRVAGLCAGLVILFDNTFFSQAVICEVYGLSMAFLALLLLALTRFGATRDRRWVNVAGLAVGLGGVHHISILFNAPACFLYLLLIAWRRDDIWAGIREAFGVLGRLAMWAVAVLPIYVYLPIRSALQPAMNWGETHTLDGFIAHISGRMYATTLLNVSPGDAARFAYNHTYLVLHDQQWGAVLGVVGLLVCLRRRTAVGVLLAGVFASNIYFAAHYRVGDRANYALPAHVAAALLCGFAAAWLGELAGRARGGLLTHRRVAALVATVVLLLPMLPGPPSYVPPLRRCIDYSFMRHNLRCAQETDAVLAEVPTNGVLNSALDELTNAFWYRQLVQGLRRDVTLLQFTHIDRPDEKQKAVGWIRYYLATNRVFLAWFDPFLLEHFDLIAHDATVEPRPKGSLPPNPLGLAPVAKTWELPGCQSWRLGGSRVDGPVKLPGATVQETVVGLRARMVAKLQAQLVSQGVEAGDEEAVVLIIHRDLEDYLAGRRAAPPSALNDSTTTVNWSWSLRWPLRCEPRAGADTTGLSTVLALPVWMPDVAGGGDYQVRLGVVPRNPARVRDNAQDPRLLRTQTQPVGWVRLYWR